ncbi:MAG: hypothetical protein DMG43_15035 [Acidobacteria bacterium]|nr:MAG: hypothetical protein DMG43_15035 [Acidobacteriota bacterium]
MLREEFVAYLTGVDLEKRENWYLQSIRDLLETLLANPSCTSGADEMAEVLKKINRIQRARPRTAARAAAAEY